MSFDTNFQKKPIINPENEPVNQRDAFEDTDFKQ